MSKKQATQTTEPTTQVSSILNSETLNTSQKIRALALEGLERGMIAKLLNKRYQHVRNVLITPIKSK
jgi:hypothetical protein